ncbi:hypothetical protein J6590_073433 [Homalodisca vitripennis]|nr:hypothetical protein J6590_073433 [Homalodisca vitripennis]
MTHRSQRATRVSRYDTRHRLTDRVYCIEPHSTVKPTEHRSWRLPIYSAFIAASGLTPGIWSHQRHLDHGTQTDRPCVLYRAPLHCQAHRTSVVALTDRVYCIEPHSTVKPTGHRSWRLPIYSAFIAASGLTPGIWSHQRHLDHGTQTDRPCVLYRAPLHCQAHGTSVVASPYLFCIYCSVRSDSWNLESPETPRPRDRLTDRVYCIEPHSTVKPTGHRSWRPPIYSAFIAASGLTPGIWSHQRHLDHGTQTDRPCVLYRAPLHCQAHGTQPNPSDSESGVTRNHEDDHRPHSLQAHGRSWRPPIYSAFIVASGLTPGIWSHQRHLDYKTQTD